MVRIAEKKGDYHVPYRNRLARLCVVCWRACLRFADDQRRRPHDPDRLIRVIKPTICPRDKTMTMTRNIAGTVAIGILSFAATTTLILVQGALFSAAIG